MKLDELQREAELLSAEERRKLIGFLVARNIRRDDAYRNELARRLDDREPGAWISLRDAERNLIGR